jgi:hypothetical protein
MSCFRQYRIAFTGCGKKFGVQKVTSVNGIIKSSILVKQSPL